MNVIEQLVATIARVGGRELAGIVGTTATKHRGAWVVRLGSLTMGDEPVRWIDGGVHRRSLWIRVVGHGLDGDLSIIVEPSVSDGASCTLGVVLWDSVHRAGTTTISRDVTTQRVPTDAEVAAELELAVDMLRQLERRWDEVVPRDTMVEKFGAAVADIHQAWDETTPEWGADTEVQGGDPDRASPFLTQLQVALENLGHHASGSPPSPSDPSQ